MCGRLTGIEGCLQGLDVCGYSRHPVDPHLFQPPTLNLLQALTNDVGNLGALAPGDTADVRGQGAGSCCCCCCSWRCSDYSLGDGGDLDTKHSHGLPAWHSLQTELPGGELDGDFDFNLKKKKTASVIHQPIRSNRQLVSKSEATRGSPVYSPRSWESLSFASRCPGDSGAPAAVDDNNNSNSS